MRKSMLVSAAALVLVGTAGNASPRVTPSPDNRIVAIRAGAALPPATKLVPGGKYLFTTFNTKDKEALYFGCCYGFTISGPSSFLGVAYGVAEQFIPKKNASVTILAAGIGYVSGNKTVTMTLYADNGNNSPGAVLASGTGTVATQWGVCCAVTSVTIPSTSLDAGTPYWIGITTTGSNFDTAAAQIADEVDEYSYVADTTNGGDTWGAGSLVLGVSLPALGIK